MLQLHTPQTIAIIGGGFSGAMVAVHLLRHATQPLHIKLIEPRAIPGQGIAYSTSFDCHLLNVPVGKMSAFPDLPNHFLEWLHHPCANVVSSLGAAETVTAGTFVSRRLYGEYVQSVLAEAQRNARSGVELEYLQAEAEAIYPRGQGASIDLNSGQVVQTNQVVLALGNFPPANPPVDDPAFYQSSRYVGNPWSSQALMEIDLDQPLLLVGSGLTMLDWAIALHQRGFRNTIHVISRRGLLPQSHRVFSKPFPAPLPAHQASQAYALTQPDFPPTTRLLLRWLRQEVELAQQQGSDWRAVIDALRPQTQAIWQSLSLSEQQRFLRHVRPYWEVHRHRVAPQVAETIRHLLQTGQMQVWTGRIQSYCEQAQGVKVCFRPRQSTTVQHLMVSKVINCTGSECNYRKFRHPLIKGLLQTGLAAPDPLELGLKVTTNGALVEASGQASDWLFTLGSAQKGSLWETTAVPELRQQAATLAQFLLKTYQSSRSESYQISRSKSFKYSSAL